MRSSLLCSLLLAVPALVHAAYPPQEPSASLDALLKDVWAKGVEQAYTLYVEKPKVEMDTAAREAYAKQILDIAKDDNVAGIILQKARSKYAPKSHLPDVAEFDDAYFVHFVRPDMKGDSITERIYINVHPNHGTEVMRFVVRELLAREHGVQEAKLGTPHEMETRADSLVIYLNSLAEVDWALGLLKEYQAAHRDHFLPDLPAATRPRLTGVSTAAQPAKSLKADSFGQYMALAARKAMEQSPAPADFVEFRKRAREVMAADGVDPDHPDRLTHRP
jgi:hypothetical protein